MLKNNNHSKAVFATFAITALLCGQVASQLVFTNPLINGLGSTLLGNQGLFLTNPIGQVYRINAHQAQTTMVTPRSHAIFSNLGGIMNTVLPVGIIFNAAPSSAMIFHNAATESANQALVGALSQVPAPLPENLSVIPAADPLGNQTPIGFGFRAENPMVGQTVTTFYSPVQNTAAVPSSIASDSQNSCQKEDIPSFPQCLTRNREDWSLIWELNPKETMFTLILLPLLNENPKFEM
eukprot:TRINITY_DN11501_c0_g1_i1.p1 TRINITY_DN11501_c0_g1~~TRINITY_DN11501_c0_g1_i1.p1  ORF type:complete len:237 (+),score=59.93 TRINITY_DN11501_c0_g1_i1:52-762(+)